MQATRPFEFDHEDFAFVVSLIKERAGIVIAENKQDMVYGRLARRLRALGMRSFRQYRDFISSSDGDDEFFQFLNALTTNLTRFFRESHHFDHLGRVLLKNRLEKGRKTGERRLRIWSAASSSGEEPYSIAMTVLATSPEFARWDARILATDIDTAMLDKCRTGIYDAVRSESIPSECRRFFEDEPNHPGHIRMKDELRKLLVFKRLNLLEHWPMKGPFDAIFCRNVAIYFDRPTQKRMFERFADLLADDGFLYIGHAENLFNITDRFKLIGQTIYRKA